MAAFGQHRLCPLERRFLDEPRDWSNTFPFASGNIAEACGRMVGLDSEGHDPARLRLWPCQRDRFMEGGDVADVMIAGTNQQNFVLVRQHCRQRDCGGTIALHRLEQDTRSCPRYGTKLRLLCLLGDDDWRREGVAEPFERLLEQVLLADQRKKMLRPLRGG